MNSYFYCFLFLIFCKISAAQQNPNVIFILADDMGYGDVSCLNSNSKISTPNIDKLAREGKTFIDAHSPASLCTPTRYAILTGRYGWRSSLKKGVLKHYDPPLIEEGRFTIGQLFKENNYNTACIGKWHLGWEWSLNNNSFFSDSLKVGNDAPADRFRIEKLVDAQKKAVNGFLNEAKKLIEAGDTGEKEGQGGLALLRAYRGLPKNKAIIKLLGEPGMKALLTKVENYYMQDQQKEMHKADAGLYFVIESTEPNFIQKSMNSNMSRTMQGVLLALTSAFLSAIFSIINGKFAQRIDATIVSFYELLGGVLFLSVFLLFTKQFSTSFFNITLSDFMWLGILASVCTAYAFIASVNVMKYISPYTVMLTINLEPVYGIALAVLIFEKNEQMSFSFYIGATIILITVILNGLIRNRKKSS
jgi:hypothetical protein